LRAGRGHATTGRRGRRVRPRSAAAVDRRPGAVLHQRSEEHTSELQSPYDLVCRLLLEKKKTNITKIVTQSIVIIIKRLYSVVRQRESVKIDILFISISLSQCLHSFPTRRSSDLLRAGRGHATTGRRGRRVRPRSAAAVDRRPGAVLHQ